MTTVRRVMAVGAVLAFAAVISRSPVQGDSAAAKDSNRKSQAEAKNADQLLENLAAAKFAEEGVLTYETKDAVLLFALKLQPKVDAYVVRPRDYLVLMDTTASQAGPCFIAQRAVLRQLAKKLGDKDRLAIWTVNTKSVDVTKGFHFKGAAQLDDAIQAIDNVTPMGAADLKTALQKSVSAFEGNADRQAVVLYLGDGVSTLNPLEENDRVQLSRDLVSRKIAFFPVPVGLGVDPQVVHSFATFTGGTALRIDLRETVAATIKRFQDTIGQPIVYVNELKLPAEVAEFMPTRLPPLRSDAPTLVLGRLSKPITKLDYSLTGIVAGRQVTHAKSEPVHASSHDCFFLASMHEQWKEAKDVPALLRADRTLAFAADNMNAGRHELLAQARIALAHDKFDLAGELFTKAKEMAPKDAEAIAGLKIVEQFTSGKLKKENLVAIGGVKDGVKQAPAGGKKEDDLLNRIEHQREIEAQRLQFQVQETIKQARRELADNPEEALRRLKVMEEAVRLNPDIREELRRKLAQQLENDTRQSQQEAQRLLAARAERERQLAEAKAREDILRAEEQAQRAIRTAMSQYEALVEQGRLDEAYRQAELARQLAPDVVAATNASLRAEMADNLKTILQIKKDKETNFLATMLQIERSHIPFPDEPPVAYAPASFYETKIYRNWGELSERRKKRWGTATFSELPSKEVERMENLLDQPTDKHRNGFNQGELMKDVLDVLTRSHNVTFRVDETAMKSEEAGFDRAAWKLDRDVGGWRGIALGTILRDTLASTTPPATYLIRADHIEITSVRQALTEKTVRVYPVADLVFDRLNFSGSGLGGFGGGVGGAGGLGGIGGGGLGGGQFAGGLGGGGLGGFGGGGLGGGLGGLGGGGLGGLGGFGGGGLGGFGGGGLGGFGGGGLGGLGGGGLGGGLGGLGGGGLGGFGGGLGGGFGGLGGGLGGAGGIGGGLGGGVGGGLGGQGFQGGGFSNPQARFINAIRLRDLITRVIGTVNDWAQPPTNNQNQGGNPPPASTLPAEMQNDLDYYDPAFALVVKGSARVHSRSSSTLKFEGAAPQAGNFRDNGQRFANKDRDSKDAKGNGVAKKDEAKPAGGKPAGKPDTGEAVAAMDWTKPANTNPDAIWDDALKGKFTKPSWAIGVAAMLGKHQKWDHAAEFLKAALRHGVMARPWMFEAIATALEANHGDPDEIERALLSTADLRPNDAGGLLHAARVMAQHKRWSRALEFCKQSAAQNSEMPLAYLLAAECARETKDATTLGWAAENLLARDWPIRQEEFHSLARRGLDDLSQILAKEGKKADADRLIKISVAPQQRDLVIRLIWQGEADLDLEVKEPIGTKCNFMHRMSPGGGAIRTDFAAEHHTESYVAAQAFSGEYQVSVRRVWGSPAGKKATLEIIHGKGTAEERIQRETLTLEDSQSMTVKLESGRRTSPAVVPSLASLRRIDTEAKVERTTSVTQQLQALATPVVNGIDGMMEGSASGYSRPKQADDAIAVEEEDAHQSAVAPWFGTGASLTVEAVVSGDRRYVRLNMNPTITQVRGLQNRNPLLPLGTSGSRP